MCPDMHTNFSHCLSGRIERVTGQGFKPSTLWGADRLFSCCCLAQQERVQVPEAELQSHWRPQLFTDNKTLPDEVVRLLLHLQPSMQMLTCENRAVKSKSCCFPTEEEGRGEEAEEREGGGNGEQ